MMPLKYIHGDLNTFHCFVIRREQNNENPSTRNVYLFRSPAPNRIPRMIHFNGEGVSTVFKNIMIYRVHNIMSTGFIEKKLLIAGNAIAKNIDIAARDWENLPPPKTLAICAESITVMAPESPDINRRLNIVSPNIRVLKKVKSATRGG